MSFKATEVQSGEQKVFPKIKGGEEGTWSLPARISLIVDLGTQDRKDFQEEYDEKKDKHIKALANERSPATLTEEGGKTMINIPQMPNRQVIFFADLVTEMLDYGENIGKKPARIMLNKMFKGEITGTPLTIMQARDNTGNIIEGSPKTFHTTSLATKLGKACGVNFVKNGNDISELAGKAFAATIESKASGENVYTNYKSASPMMEGIEVPALAEDCQLITFEEATKDQIKSLWKPVREAIKKSKDFEGSQIQQAMKEFELEQAQGNSTPAAQSSVAEPEAPSKNDPPF